MADPIDEVELEAEVRRVVRETADRIASGAESPSGAYFRAYGDACARGSRVGNAAGIIAGWLIESSGGSSNGSAAGALRVLEAQNADSELGKAVYELIRGVATVEMSDEDFLARTGKPWRGTPTKTRRRRRAAAPGAFEVTRAEETLRTMLGEAGVDVHDADPLAIWEVFKLFAGRSAETAEGDVQHDVCLFQWGTYDWGKGQQFEWELTRQFTLADDDGDYDHMEQLHCTVLFGPEAPLGILGSGDHWSGDDVNQWFGEVEVLEAFTVPPALSRPIGVRVEQERV